MTNEKLNNTPQTPEIPGGGVDYRAEIKAKYDYNEFSLRPDFKQTTLRLELTNICNDKCIFCINPKMKRKKIHMEDELIYRVIREAAELGVKKAGYFIAGEPFVSERLADYVRYGKEQGISYIFITTNGGLATREKLKNVLDAGLDSLKFSINAGSPETYKIVQGRDDYEKVLENLRYVYEYRKTSGLSYKILSSCVVTKYTQEEVESIYKTVRPYTDDLVFFAAGDWAGTLAGEKLKVKIKENLPQIDAQNKLPCSMLFNSINVSCEGYLTCCCSDGLNMLATVDLHEVSLKDAWYNEDMINMRRRHLNNDVTGIQCYNCVNHAETPVEPLNRTLYEKCIV